MNKIKEVYQAKGWTRLKLAKELGVAESTLWRWEQGACNMQAYNRDLLCEVLGTSAKDLGIDLLTVARMKNGKNA